jgi:hypothetical protein
MNNAYYNVFRARLYLHKNTDQIRFFGCFEFFEIKSNKNIFSIYQNENEIILRMGTQFHVKCDALMQSNGSHIVHLIQNNDDDGMNRRKIILHQLRMMISQ